MAESAPLPGILLIAAFCPVDQLILKFITMTSESQLIRALCAHIKVTGKRYADLNGAPMDNSLQAVVMIISSAFGI
jgi:hypothetical protein